MSQSRSSTPTPLGTFVDLPPEIRQSIYALVFPTSPFLLLTSKALKAETTPSLYQYGIYRSLITFHRATTAGEAYTYYAVSERHSTSAYLRLRPPCIPEPATLDRVQNIDICIDMPEPYTHCSYDFWSHHTWGPGGFITHVVERIIAPMKQRKSCRLTFILGSVVELHPLLEPRMLDYLLLLKSFETAVVELRKRPWIDDYPKSFGRRVQAENDADVKRLDLLRAYLGHDGETQEVDGNTGSVKIVRSTIGGGNVEVLWDSTL